MSTPPTRPLSGTNVPAAPDVSTANRLKWLLVFRSAVVTVLLASSFVVRASTDEALFARAAVALYGVAALAYASILLGALLLRWWPGLSTQVAYSQLVADALIASTLVWLTGGHESVFVFIYSLSVLNAAIVLNRQASLILAGISAALFTVVAVATGPSPDLRVIGPSIATNGASFFLVAVLSGYLTAQLTRTSARLEDARAQIVKLEGLYAAVLSSLPSGVMSVGEGGDVLFVNAAGREILGSGNLVGRPVESIARDIAPLLRRTDSTRFELEVDLAGRGQRILGGSVAPLVGIDDPGRVLVFQDLTELRRLQEDVARAERLAELGRLAASLAHEIRNPLAAMIGCLQLLVADNASAEGDSGRLLGIVQREAERLSGLVQAFLTYARPSDPRRERLSVRRLLEETTGAVRHGLQGSTLELAEIPDAFLSADPDQLRQVIWNVVTNADKIGEGQNRKLRVVVGAEIDGDALTITVDDDGPGVPEALRQRIFEPFFTTRPDGNGLGLATSNQLISRNGGVLGAQRSPLLGGARFTIRLPLEVPPPAQP